MNSGQIVFLILAFIAVMGALGVVGFGDKPVWSALCLVLNIFVLAFIYFTMGAQFIGITQIMVYAGAIMVLFLFVIMILKLGSREKEFKSNSWVAILGIAFSVVIVAAIGKWCLTPFMENTPLVFRNDPKLFGPPQTIGMEMFSRYVWPFEIASILLTIGIVGSILLAKRRI